MHQTRHRESEAHRILMKIDAGFSFENAKNSLRLSDVIHDVIHVGLPDFLQQNTGDFCISVTFVKDNYLRLLLYYALTRSLQLPHSTTL